MPVVHSVIRVDRIDFFIANFFNQSGKHRTGNLVHFYFINFINRFGLNINGIQCYFFQYLDLH